MGCRFINGMTILFHGDSIIDSGRREAGRSPLGNGYAFLVASWLSALCPERGLRFAN
jgi:hypothetical protein